MSKVPVFNTIIEKKVQHLSLLVLSFQGGKHLEINVDQLSACLPFLLIGFTRQEYESDQALSQY